MVIVGCSGRRKLSLTENTRTTMSHTRQTVAESKAREALEDMTGLVSRSITALIPCHNEQECLPQAIQSLLLQTRPPDRIVVVADNCTDDTVKVGRSCGVDVWKTVANHYKKVGALNQAFERLLPSLTLFPPGPPRPDLLGRVGHGIILIIR